MVNETSGVGKTSRRAANGARGGHGAMAAADVVVVVMIGLPGKLHAQASFRNPIAVHPAWPSRQAAT